MRTGNTKKFASLYASSLGKRILDFPTRAGNVGRLASASVITGHRQNQLSSCLRWAS